ncbi:hypothetical protein NDR87_26175 [Nocardia sp. CDC159]|uniref:Uncharacterized protein n=1 Tax=Nocardia pulmonis TaxID=2951408 RepID=A0A9X2E6Y9_9NOCA|nr:MULTISPECIES: hypothetical protein [Nocardia]MCM6774934.1 hypothetical protein [Nocardia pulmonis]MCM6789865.1 hypothetical protein [Nocardia sp. CDC159]
MTSVLPSVPMPPRGVRILRGDTAIPVEVVYVGLREDGQHVWAGTIPSFLDTDQVDWDWLPSRTCLEFDVGGDDRA